MKNNKGVGLTEIVIAMAILSVIALGISISSTGQRQANLSLSAKETCQQAARNIAYNIKAYENDMTIRNWMGSVQNSNSDMPAMNALDPLCSSSRTKGVCGDLEMLAGNGANASLSDFYNFLNRRNSATWAYMVYNLSKQGVGDFVTSPDPNGRPNQCSIYLADFDTQYLPTPIMRQTLFPDYEGLVTLKVTQTNGTNMAQCNRSQVEPRKGVFFHITAGVYLKERGSAQWSTSCAAETSVGYRPDNDKANVTLQFQNLAGEPLDPTRLSTDPTRPYNLCVSPSGQPYNVNNWGLSRGIIAELVSSEPGTYFRCEASLSSNPSPGLRKCTAARLALQDMNGNAVMEGDFDWINHNDLYNKRPHAKAQWGGNPQDPAMTRAPLPYATPFVGARPVLSLSFEATDVGRNQTRVPAAAATAYHFTLNAQCPSSNTYCPNAPPLHDGCGGICAQGTMNGTNTPSICMNPKLFCNYHRPCDTCELQTCPGTRGQPQRIGPKDPAQYLDPNTYDCPPADTYYPCENRYDYCGQVCPRGTKAVPMPDLNRFCSTESPRDACGNPHPGNVDCSVPGVTAPNDNGGSICPAQSSYCGAAVGPSAIGAPATGTHLVDWDGSACADGTFGTTPAGGCPAVTDYCQGAGQFVRNSCGQDCPAGIPGPAIVAACCMGCNSLGNPPSFKRSTSCDQFNTGSGGNGTCTLINNCYQFSP